LRCIRISAPGGSPGPSPLDGATAEALLTAFLRLYGAAGEWDRVDAVVQAIQPFTGVTVRMRGRVGVGSLADAPSCARTVVIYRGANS